MRMQPELAPYVMPHDQDAEMALVAAVLADNSRLLDVASFINPGSFYNPGHGAIWEAVSDLYLGQNKIAEPVTVYQWLASKQMVTDAGGVDYLVDLVKSYSQPEAATHYADIVRGFSIRRQLIRASDSIKKLADDRSIEAICAAEQAEQLVFDVINKQQRGQTVHMGTAVNEAAERIERRVNKTIADDGVPTGWQDVDRILGSMENGALVVIAARPGYGKTAFVMNIARNVAKRRMHVLLCSLEMNRIEIGERFISMETEIDGLFLKRGILDESQKEKIAEATGVYNGLSWSIDDSPHQTVMQIAAAARREKSKNDMKLLIIDYMQLIVPDEERVNRQEQVAKISRRLKILARELNVPVIVLAQVNRKSEDRADGRIKVSDLRESGAIEQDADVVALLQCDDPDRNNKDDVEMDIEIGKNRNGMTGCAKLQFRKFVSRFDQKVWQQNATM